MRHRFAAADLALLRDEEEVELETSAAADAPLHRAVIWVVVDDLERMLIRSYRGPGARWFREITAHPDARVHVQGPVVEVHAVHATDPDRVASCSKGFLGKYAGQHSARSMASNHLETTLELVPR
jgi:hypothetical protein